MLLTTLTAAAILATTLTGAPSTAPTPPTPTPISQPEFHLPAVVVPDNSPLSIQRAVLRSEAPPVTVAPVAAVVGATGAGANPLEAEYVVEPEPWAVAAGTVAPVNTKRSGNVGTVAPTSSSPSGSGSAIVTEARRHLGVPYVWGGTSTRGFDCSGLVQYVLRDLGVSVPRQARAQATVGTRVSSLAQAQPGDLLGMRNGTHIAIYLGDNTIIHSPRPGETVSVRALSAGDDIDTIRRVL